MTTGELASLLAIPAEQVRHRLHAPGRRGEWISPTRGLWMPVPPEFRTWGAPPGVEVIDQMATHLGVGYYIGWLSAAELFGAAHHAPQVFQVAVTRQVRDRQIGRTRFEFHQRSRVGSVPVVGHPTRSGMAQLATRAVTMLDVATDVSVAAGIDNAATVIVELSEDSHFDPAEIIPLVHHYPIATVRRLGWLLENYADQRDLEFLRSIALTGPNTAARLDPSVDLVGPFDKRWNIRINNDVQVDA